MLKKCGIRANLKHYRQAGNLLVVFDNYYGD